MSSRFLITQSLLSAWLYTYKSDTGYEDFLKTLLRERTPPTKAMLEGQRFENCVNAVCKGAEVPPDHEWYKPIMELKPALTGAQQQVRLSRDLTVSGITFVCYGVLDFLKAGIIFDTKYSKTYRVGKYLDSPQHPMYFYIVPEARKFQYLICDGEHIYTETYRPDDAPPLESAVKHFMDFLDTHGLVKTYCDNWKSKYD